MTSPYAFWDADRPGGWLLAPGIAHGLVNYSFEQVVAAEWTLSGGAARSAAVGGANGGGWACALTGAGGSQAQARQTFVVTPGAGLRNYWRITDLDSQGLLPRLSVRFFARQDSGAETLRVALDTMLGAAVVESFFQDWNSGTGMPLVAGRFAAYRAGPFQPTTAAFDRIRLTVGLPAAAGGAYTIYVDDLMLGQILDTNDFNPSGFFEDGFTMQSNPDMAMNRMENGTIEGWLFSDGQRQGDLRLTANDDQRRIDLVEPFDDHITAGTPVTIAANGNDLSRNFIAEALLNADKRGLREMVGWPFWQYDKKWREVAVP